MKKIVCVAAIVVMVFAFVGCGGGSESKYVGKWTLTKANYAGMEISPEEMGMKATLDIKDSGKLVMDFDGESAEADWEEKDGKLLIKGGDVGDLTAEMKDKAIVLEYSGVEMIFEK